MLFRSKQGQFITVELCAHLIDFFAADAVLAGDAAANRDAQFQDFAAKGLPPEGRMAIAYQDQPVTLGDGSMVTLRKPGYLVADPGFGPLDPQVMLSPRIAPQMIGRIDMGVAILFGHADETSFR